MEGKIYLSPTTCLTFHSLTQSINLHFKLSDVNSGQYYGIGLIMCQFPNVPHVYPIGPVYYCPNHF